MRSLVIGAVLTFLTVPAFAEEGGCVKDGAVGAVAGHMVGSGHGVAGAAAGCAYGAHERNKAEKDKAQQANQQPQGNQQPPPPKK
jgi:hypothetical protein